MAGHRTSVALEPEFWSAVERVAADCDQSVAQFVAAIDARRTPERPLASALRVAMLNSQPVLSKR